MTTGRQDTMTITMDQIDILNILVSLDENRMRLKKLQADASESSSFEWEYYSDRLECAEDAYKAFRQAINL